MAEPTNEASTTGAGHSLRGSRGASVAVRAAAACAASPRHRATAKCAHQKRDRADADQR
ncbi:MAG: hypothetical protein RL417_2304 [Pseudomonadota bacterium]